MALGFDDSFCFHARDDLVLCLFGGSRSIELFVKQSLNAREITVVVLDDFGWQVVQYVLFEPSEQKGQYLLVKRIEGKGSCIGNRESATFCVERKFYC